MSEPSVSVTETRTPPPHLRGRRLRKIGAATFWIALVLLFATVPLSQAIGYAGLALMAVALPALFLGLAVMRRGRKLMAASGEELLAQDDRAPVVYLRPFAADELGTRVATRFLGWRYFTEEEQLAMVMDEIDRSSPSAIRANPSRIWARRAFMHAKEAGNARYRTWLRARGSSSCARARRRVSGTSWRRCARRFGLRKCCCSYPSTTPSTPLSAIARARSCHIRCRSESRWALFLALVLCWEA